MIERVLVAGGGTGGHLFPGLAVVEELRRRSPDLEVLFIGTERGIEARILPKMGERLECLEVSPLKGRGPAELLQSLGKLPRALLRAGKLVRAFRPDLVIGVGGYASGPVLAAASAMGIPTAILEQNARVGLTNRMLAPLVGRAYLSFPESQSELRAARVRLLGNPVRRAFVRTARQASADPEGFEARSRRVFVLGGSQGAKILNERIPEVLRLARLEGLTILHQTGAAMRDAVEARYAELGLEAEVVSFVDEMALAYAESALVIARAGATTLAEVCAIGRPSILIPYPHAADDHQTKNAEALEAAGAAI
ncbi:MAG: undecaprenyldiphospho-muramoylpentapeptide beta-N-acetylglucosaminyltransferase, partial [Myxococcales bacterium]|nr:undecaprenyldiphospho-muramoylpentapeptide beta-N-acetylglucosaminyltransferase [Myxococcales bacterium]